MKAPTFTRDVALNVLHQLRSNGLEGKLERSDVEIAIRQLELPCSDANIEAVLAAQEVAGQMPQVEEGVAA